MRNRSQIVRHRSSIRLLVLSFVLAAPACHRTRAPALVLEECDPAGYIGCISPNSFVSIPIADTNLSLTYSSRWSSASNQKQNWDASPLGLGGWSVNVVQRYDRANRLLINGDGTWRVADAVSLPSGEQVVPDFIGAVAYTFDSAGRHVRTLDANLGIELLKISYDTAGQLLQIDGYLNGEPVHVAVRRDPHGNPRVLIGIDGASTALEVDGSRRLTSVMDPAGAETHISWNAAGLLESTIDPAGGTRRFSYDSSGYLLSETDADGVMRRYERKHSGDSLEVSVSSTMGRRWLYRAESAKGGIERTFIRPDGTESIETIDTQGNWTVKHADGTTWKIGATANPIWGRASPTLTPIVEARPDGVTSHRDIKSNLHSAGRVPYAASGSIITTINGQTWTQTLDPVQRTVGLVDPLGRRSVAQYDQKGRLLSYAAPGAEPVSYSYTTEGRLASVTAGSGKSARTVRYTYEKSTGRTVRNRGKGTLLESTTDRAGRMIATSAGDGSTALYKYDQAGRLTQIQPPGGFNFTLGLSPAGRTTAFVPPAVKEDASVEISSYDQDGYVTSISGLGNRAVSYSYDSAGRISSSSFDQGKRIFSYAPNSGLLAQTSDPSGVHATYGYVGDKISDLTWSGPFGGSVTIKRDANGRPTQQSVNGSDALSFTYDASGNLTGVGPLSLKRDATTGLVTHGALGVVETNQLFDDNGLLIHATTTVAGKPVLDLSYTRDAVGRIKSLSEQNQGKTTLVEYSYDRADRLSAVKTDGRPAEMNSYDPAGNRLRVASRGKVVRATYDDRDRLLGAAATHYTWMPDGTLAGIAQGQHATAFVYDSFGALRQVSLPDGRKIAYLVDAEGHRIGRETAGKLASGYLYSVDGSIAAETDSGVKVISRFGYDDLRHVALLQRDGITYRVITDTLGSPRLVINSATGAVADDISYDAWGNITHEKSPGFLCIGFAGGLRDPDTGLIHFGARDYDPTTGRWTASDPLRFNAGDPNLYRYAAGDPVNRVDPAGLDSSLGGVTALPPGMPYYGTGVTPPPPPQKWVLHGTPQQNGSFSPDPSQSTANTLGGCFWDMCPGPPPADLGPPLSDVPADNPDQQQNGAGAQQKGNPPHPSNQPANNPPSNWSCSSPGNCNNGSGLTCGNGSCGSSNGSSFCNAEFCSFPDGSSCYQGSCGFNPDGSFFCSAKFCSGPNGQGCSVPDSGQGTCQVGNQDNGNGNGGGSGNGNGGAGRGHGSGGGGGPGGSGSGGSSGSGPGGSGGSDPGGGGGGEPHLYSMAGLYFDFQLVGEFVVAASPDRHFEIQSRQEPERTGSAVSITSAIALNVDGDHIGIYTKEPSFLLINGAPVQKQDVDRRLPHGGSLQRHGGTVEIHWKDGSRFTVEEFAGLLNYGFVPSRDAASTMGGLLGMANGNPRRVAGRDGTLIERTDADFVSRLYKQVGNSWRIEQSESLFHYWPGESTARFTDPSFPPKLVSSATLDPDTHARAELICRAVGIHTDPVLGGCILDVGLTGMPALAAASVGMWPSASSF